MSEFNSNPTIFSVPYNSFIYNKSTVFNAITNKFTDLLIKGNYPVIQGTTNKTTYYYTIKMFRANSSPIILPNQLNVTKYFDNPEIIFISYDVNDNDSIPTYVLMFSDIKFEESTFSNKHYILLKFIAGDMKFMANNGYFTQLVIDGILSKVYMCYQHEGIFKYNIHKLKLNFGPDIPHDLKSKLC